MKTKKEKKNSGKLLFLSGVALVVVCALVCAVLASFGAYSVFRGSGEFTKEGEITLVRAMSAEDEGYDDDSTVCDVEYVSEDGKYSATVRYTYEEWENLPEGNTINGIIYKSDAGDTVTVREGANEAELKNALHNLRADKSNALFQSAVAI